MKTTLIASCAVTALLLFVAPAMAGSAANSSANSSSNSSASSSSNSQSGALAVAGGGYASAGNVSSSNSVNIRGSNVKQAPGIGLAGLAVGGLSCRGSASFGASFPGGGFGFGTTIADDECERRQWAGMLASAKDRRAQALAWAIMQRSVIVQQAMQDTGIGIAAPVAYRGAAPVARGGNSRVTANAGCQKWAGGNVGGQCVY